MRPETIGTTLDAVAGALELAGHDQPRRRARRLVAAALALSQSEVFAARERTIGKDAAARITAVLKRALAHEPLSRILGAREFWGLEFALGADTLDPRPESETIVEAVLARLPERERAYRFADLGTGSGCLLLALLSEYPATTGIGLDRAFGAAATARANAARLGFARRAVFAVGDWASALVGQFAAIVANPPYIASAEIASLPAAVRDFDPLLALDGGADGLDAYRALARDLPGLLSPDGLFVCEVGRGQESAVAGIIRRVGLVIDAIVPDLAGIARCVVARRAA